MAALTAITPTLTGALSAPAAVAASDTIAQALLGGRGAYLDIINASGSSDTITISDHSVTGAGNPLASNAVAGLTVAAGTAKTFFVSPAAVNPATGLVTVTHTQTATVTYKLFTVL